MNIRRMSGRLLSAFMALSVITGGVDIPAAEKEIKPITASAADSTEDPRILVDINANDGRKPSYTTNGNNWIVASGTSATTTIGGLTFTLSNGGSVGSGIKSGNCKLLQKSDGTSPTLTMDGVSIDGGENGGTIKLEIKGLSAGTHSLKTWHSCMDGLNISTMSVSVNGKTTASGIKAVARVKDDDDAGISYSTFEVSSGQTVTVLIKPEGNGTVNNAYLNAFEIDGGDPIKGVSRLYPEHNDKHVPTDEALSWTAGEGALSHNVYIGTDFSSVFNATTSSPEYMGNQTGTSYALDDSYSSLETYYWRVDTVNSSGTVKGAVYSFMVGRLSFPTAEGYGRFARGGRGGKVLHVTNLNDSGEGSLRWALQESTGPRIIVFDVGGVIELEDTLWIKSENSDVYVAGQTAPGDGITLINHDFSGLGAEDVVLRNIRVRVGDSNGESTGGMGLASCNHCIVDHCSISWGTDEGFSSRGARNITFQRNIIAESLNNSVHYNWADRTETERHAFAASISGDIGTFHHNLLIHCTDRNWSLAGGLGQDVQHYQGSLDLTNNVIYNWRNRTTDGGIGRVQFVNNYYKMGPESRDMALLVISDNAVSTPQKAYVSGNKMTDISGNTKLSPSQDAWSEGRATSTSQSIDDTRSNSPFWDSHLNIQSADEAYESVLSDVGANAQGLDVYDSRYIKEVKNGTYTYTGSKDGLKGIIDSQNDVGGYPNKSNFEHSTDGVCNASNDTDRDGMPDAWENEHGLNPGDGSDGSICTLSADGYTNVEMFLNELAGDPVEYNGNGGSTLKKGTAFDTAYKYSITDSTSGEALENIGRWSFTEGESGYYKLTDADTGKALSDTEEYKFVKSGDSYIIYKKSSEDTEAIGGESQKWKVTALRDPIEGNLIKNLIPLDDSFYPLWKIDTSLETGDSVYTDRVDDRLATYETIPSELQGAEYIMTPCDAKALETDLATFTAGEDITVYVGLDNRVAAVPSWLSDWTDSGLTAVNSRGVTFVLYKKEFSKDETVTLGTNGQSSGCVNYIVAAAASDEGGQTVTTEPVQETTAGASAVIYGDADVDGDVTVADIVKIMTYVSNNEANPLTAEGLNNADVYQRGDGVGINDAVTIQKYLTKIVAELPES